MISPAKLASWGFLAIPLGTLALWRSNTTTEAVLVIVLLVGNLHADGKGNPCPRGRDSELQLRRCAMSPR